MELRRLGRHLRQLGLGSRVVESEPDYVNWGRTLGNKSIDSSSYVLENVCIPLVQ